MVDDGIYAPLASQVIAIEEVSDSVFSKKIMGDGFAVELVQGHTLDFVRADGLEVLLHVGIDTVSLKGAPFNFKVKVGDIVNGGNEVVTVDWAQVEAAGLMKTTMVVFTNSNEKFARFDIAKGQTTAATKLGTAAVK